MFVKITKDRIIAGGPRKAGEVLAVDDHTGRNLIASKWATETTPPAPADDETTDSTTKAKKKKEPTP